MLRSACRASPTFRNPEWDCTPVGNPRVSIIVPARNEEEDIELSLTRLLELDYDNYEVIAVNDRSTDRTGEIMETMAARASVPRPAARDSSPRIARRLAGKNPRHVDGGE